MAAFDAFMIVNSPKVKDEGKISKSKEVLTLAAFHPIPKIVFQDVKVGQKVSQELLIHNPNSNDVQVELIPKLPCADHNLEFTSTKFEVAAGQDFDLTVTWSPGEAGTVKIPVGLRTNTKFRADLVLLCVAVAPGKKKILGAQNGSKTSGKAKSTVVPAPRVRKPTSEPPQRRKTFVLRGNKENVASSKKPSRPEPAPRKFLPAASANHPSLFEGLVISPFVSQNRFRDVELSPAVGPWNPVPSSVSETIRRETFAVHEKGAVPTFMDKLDKVEEKFDTVDCSYKEVDSFASVFEPRGCSTSLNVKDNSFGSVNDRLSGGTYVVDRLSTDTYIKESDLNEHKFDERKALCHTDLSGTILDCISEEVMNSVPAATAFIMSPPNRQKVKRMSPRVVTRRKVAVSPVMKAFSPDTLKEKKSERETAKKRQSFSGPVPKVPLPRLTLTRAANVSRQSLGASNPPLSRSKTSSRQSLIDAYSSSRQSLTSAHNPSRQSLSSALCSSRKSLAGAHSSSRQSLNSVHSSSQQSLNSVHSSSRQSLHNQSLQNASSSSRMSKIVSVAKARRQEKSEFLYDPDALISEMINNDLVAASTSADPFLTNTLFYDDSWKLKQEKDMIKWLNVLLSPPAELAADTDLDIADVWQRCCRTDQVELAPTKEDFSADMYDIQARMNSLRKAAISFLAKTEVRQVLGKVAVHIDKKLLVIRDDKDLHLDTGLKYQIMELLLSYNPLWLRIGLEAIYGRTVCLASNSDVVGLAKFILENLLNNKHIVAAHSHPTVPHLHLPSFADAMKKFILKKFFFLVYFLDQAKTNKLIGHDPCLFMKKSKYKESREVLISFASMFLSGVGDIVKHLALLGYHVSVKQQYIDEYEFAVTRLKDLRDGVRLVRVMEIILKKNALMEKLRVPPISMLQKIHNMDIALKALSDSGYVILGNITAKDLVNGHYEKTLSLLWQIIYKFQAPRLEEAARVIQSWWNDMKLHRELRKRIAAKKRALYAAAATRIQAAWRAWLARKRVSHLREERLAEMASREAAAIVIQKTWRMYSAQKELIRAIRASNRIKEWFFGAMITRVLRAKFLAKRKAVIKIQSLFRGCLTRKRFANLRRTAAALRIQTWFRRRRAAKVFEIAATRAKVWMEERKRQSRACRVIQTRFRAYANMKEERRRFVALRNATVVIQRRFKLYLIMKKDRTAFLSACRAAIICQQVFRAKLAMKKQRIQYLAEKNAACAIQKWFRAQREMRTIRERVLLEKSAAVRIQTWFRSTQLMRRDRREYLRVKRAVIVTEERYLAVIAGRQHKLLFDSKKRSAVVIQRWYRSVKQMKLECRSYARQCNAALVIQRSYRAYMLRKLRNSSAVAIQRKWRSTLQMRAEAKAFAALRSAALTLQSRRRALMTMKKERANYENLKNVAVVIQRRWRALRAGKNARREYLNLEKAAVVLQRRWRANLQMKREKAAYLRVRSAAIVIQHSWRAVLKRWKGERLRKAAIVIQRMWRAKKLAQRQRSEFLTLKTVAILVQRKYRQKITLRSGIAARLRQEQAAVNIQALWRGYITRKKQCAASAEINERCRIAAEAACQEKTLAYRTQSAVHLIRLGQCNKAMEALAALNKITVFSRELCIALVEDDVVTDIYNFLSQLNRSEFHRQFLIPGTAILLNLTKYSETTPYVWQNGSRVFFYLHLMNVWINREEEIFLNCATILWHFAQYPDFAQEMIAEPKMSRLLEIFARKATKKTSLLAPNKNGSILPADSPSWGLVLKDGKPSRFYDELFAIQNIRRLLYG